MNRPAEFLILGCGYTGRHVAQTLLKNTARVVCTNRSVTAIPGAECIALDAANPESLVLLRRHVSPGVIVLHSIPADGGEQNPRDYTAEILDALRPLAPARVVYISTTGVYGAAQQVDHLTAVAPETARDRLRVEAEKRVAAGPWEHLILRPAAIYGPGRGVHHSFRLGKYREPTDHRIISRIHVDDLAAEVTAGLRGNVTGAFPVADEEPCRSIDVAILAAQVLGLPAPQKPASLTETGRRVDGSEFRRLSGVTLRFRSYREGVPDCLAAEL